MTNKEMLDGIIEELSDYRNEEYSEYCDKIKNVIEQCINIVKTYYEVCENDN